VCVRVRVRVRVYTSVGAHFRIPLSSFAPRQPVRKSYTDSLPLCLRFAKPVKGVCSIPARCVVVPAGRAAAVLSEF